MPGLRLGGESRLSCDDDPRFSSDATTSSGLGEERGERDWRKNSQPVGSSLRGFQEISLLKALTISRGRDHRQIRKEHLAAQTRGGARYFMRKVAVMAQQLGLPPPSVSRPAPPRNWLFSLAPGRRWRAEPLHIYRGVSAVPDSEQQPATPP